MLPQAYCRCFRVSSGVHPPEKDGEWRGVGYLDGWRPRPWPPLSPQLQVCWKCGRPEDKKARSKAKARGGECERWRKAVGTALKPRGTSVEGGEPGRKQSSTSTLNFLWSSYIQKSLMWGLHTCFYWVLWWLLPSLGPSEQLVVCPYLDYEEFERLQSILCVRWARTQASHSLIDLWI